MNVFGIVCSPRKGGNTEILVNEALAAARELHADTEIFSVAGKTINPCDSCEACRKTKVCHIKDDMQEIYQEMEQADALVFGTPVYYGSVSAQAKAVMDRTYAYYAERRLKGKVAAPVLAVRRVGGAQTRNLLYGYFMAQGMIPVRGTIGYGWGKGDVLKGVGAAPGISAIDEARNVGKDVIELLKQLGKT